MRKLNLVAWLLFSLAWRTTRTACGQSRPVQSMPQLLATHLQNYMDTTALPCGNFYQFACGNWHIQQQQQHSPQGRLQLLPRDTLGIIDSTLNRRLELLLRRSTDTGNLIEQMRRYYRSCKRVKPYSLKKYLQQLPPSNLTHWPLVARGWRRDNFDWITTIGRLRLYGLNGVMLREDVLPRWDDSRIFSIYVNKPSRQETLPMGEGAMIELLLDIGQTKRDANALARLVDAFERQLHSLQELEDDEGPREMQLRYLATFLPQLRWLSFMGQISVNMSLNLSSTLIIENIPYLRALSHLVKNHMPDTICSYIMLKWLTFLKQQGPAAISREECVSSMRRAMPLGSSWFIGQSLYDPHSELGVNSLFQSLKHRFSQILSVNRLRLSPSLVHILLKKLHAMRLQFGIIQPVETDKVEQYHMHLNLSNHSFYGNQLQLLRLRVEASHQLLSLDANWNSTENNLSYITESWDASNSSPIYVRPRNLVMVPHGLLQLPLWHRNVTSLQQHAVLGFALAHELVRGFDMAGIEYDALGNIIGPVEEIAASKEFRQGRLCIQKQMANGSKWIDGKLADYEALRLAYETFFGVQADLRVPRNQLLPQFSQRQLFFINFAQFFCGRTPVFSQRSQAQEYLEHAVSELRVMESLANFEEFSREFGCNKRTKMQASQQCRFW
ncbi:hypothetical protein KR009_008999 [Drosophila setifemur]|nr:hypothetical protein KR009_008999 [Drosophila setifemur]